MERDGLFWPPGARATAPKFLSHEFVLEHRARWASALCARWLQMGQLGDPGVRVPPRLRPRQEPAGAPGTLASTPSCFAALPPGLQFAALGSPFYGPEFSFQRLWERLSLSTDSGAIISI